MDVHTPVVDVFSTLSFRHPWRPYQRRVLEAIDQHLDDQRLHVVAAPGAGKTTLGLEVFRRLGKPALVLSPTRVIRDQWVLRLVDFVGSPDASQLPWVSTTLDRPAVLTSITYQALHTRVADDLGADGEDNAEIDPEAPGETQIQAIVDALRQHQKGVLILDEAHRPRSARSGTWSHWIRRLRVG